jgi:hypothetical protein
VFCYEELLAKGNVVDPKPSCIYVTTVPIISQVDCDRVIEWAEDCANVLGSWTTSRHYAVPTTDIPVHSSPRMLEWFNEVLMSKIGPLLHEQYSG